MPGVPVGQKRETSEGPGDGVTPKMVEGVDMRSDGGLVDEQRTSVAAAARHQEVAMAARERDHWGKTPVRVFFPLRSSLLSCFNGRLNGRRIFNLAS